MVANLIEEETSTEETFIEDQINAMKQQGRRKRQKKTRTSLVTSCFHDIYKLKGEILGQGAYACVETCVNTLTDMEYAVKIVEKAPGIERQRIFKEVETYYKCRGHPNIIQMFDMFEDEDRFYMVFEKIEGGQLFDRIQARNLFTERDASRIVRDLANALEFLHSQGIAHRDLKPENILCVNPHTLTPVKVCDFDLASPVELNHSDATATTPLLDTPVGSAEYMAPEVVATFMTNDCVLYNKLCDIWSLGVVTYILLCGYAPFAGHCGFDCGWERGESCRTCQEQLFCNILQGYFEFPEKDWKVISEDAKDLIRKLLIKDARRRLTAAEVLDHPWVKNGPVENEVLATPEVIRRNDSHLSAFAESAMGVNRIVVQHFELNESSPPQDNNDSELGLAPPSESTMMRRRRRDQ